MRLLNGYLLVCNQMLSCTISSLRAKALFSYGLMITQPSGVFFFLAALGLHCRMQDLCCIAGATF